MLMLVCGIKGARRCLRRSATADYWFPCVVSLLSISQLGHHPLPSHCLKPTLSALPCPPTPTTQVNTRTHTHTVFPHTKPVCQHRCGDYVSERWCRVRADGVKFSHRGTCETCQIKLRHSSFSNEPLARARRGEFFARGDTVRCVGISNKVNMCFKKNYLKKIGEWFRKWGGR